MVLHLKPLREHSHRRPLPGGKALNCEKRLMLVRLYARLSRRSFAKSQEAANFVAKVAQRLELRCMAIVVGHCVFFKLYRNTI